MKKLVLFLAGILISLNAFADSLESRLAKAKEYGEKVVTLVEKNGVDEAIKEINDPKSEFKNDIYSVFIIDFDGKTWANSTFAAYVGKNVLGAKGADGQEFVKSYIKIAKEKGSGTTEYKFLEGDKKTLGNKMAFVKKLPRQAGGKDAFVGIAFGKP